MVTSRPYFSQAIRPGLSSSMITQDRSGGRGAGSQSRDRDARCLYRACERHQKSWPMFASCIYSCHVLGYLEKIYCTMTTFKKTRIPLPNPSSPSPGPWITSLLTVSLYRCAMSPRLSSISGSSGINTQGFGGSPPSWSPQMEWLMGNKGSWQNAVELLDCHW